MTDRNLFLELIDGLNALKREPIKITRFRFRKARKPYRRRLLIPIRHRYRIPMVVRRYGLVARLR